MKIEMWSTKRVKPYENNPRKNDNAVDGVANSIREFGFRQPIVVDARGVIVVGHTRWKAAQKLELAKVPVHVAKDLPPAKARALRIADNKLGELATWDEELLPLELAGLKEAGLDLQLLGFSEKDLRAITGSGGVIEDEAPDARKSASTVHGDLWILGDHRLLCGDSTAAADVDRLMDGESAALISTDPPYLVNYTGVRAGGVGKDWSDTYREIDIKDAEAFFRGVFENVVRVAAPNAAIYCWHAHKRQALISATWASLGILDHQQIVWVKPAAVFGSTMYHFRHEPCMLGWVQGSKPTHDGDHQLNSVWEAVAGGGKALEELTKEELVQAIKDSSSVWEIDWEGKARAVDAEHPTTKPVEIFARPIRKHTKPGAICFEPFSGSGSQISAAEQLGRRCFAMELEPVFVEVAVRRWQKLTGKRATRYGPNGKKKPGIE